MSEPDSPSPDRVVGDRIASLRRVFGAALAEQAALAPEDQASKLARGQAYALTQAVVILCDILEAQQRQADVMAELVDELRELRLSAPLPRSRG